MDDLRHKEFSAAMDDAMAALTRAVCLLGFNQGKELMQQVHRAAGTARRIAEEVHQGGRLIATDAGVWGVVKREEVPPPSFAIAPIEHSAFVNWASALPLREATIHPVRVPSGW